MPIQYKAGTPANRNFDPKGRKGAADARGVYATSAFSAPLCRLDVGGPKVDATLGGDVVQLLLFTSDLPLDCRAYVLDTATNITANQPVQNLKSLLSTFVCDTAGGGAAVAVSNYGKVLTGYSGVGQLVPVSGFPATMYSEIIPPYSGTSNLPLGIVNPGDADEVTVDCIAASGSLAGVIGPNGSSFDTTGAPNPIILKSKDYTAAMRENKNLYTAGLYQYQIVGLYYNTTP